MCINPISTPLRPARKRADCRVVREIASSAVDLDGDGVADVTDRSWHFEYDPRFGSDPGSLSDGAVEGTVRWHAPQIDKGDWAARVGINESLPYPTLHANMRARVNDLENVLKNLGLLMPAVRAKRFGIGDTSPNGPLGVVIGYSYAKRAAIADNQRKNAGSIKGGDTATGGAGGAGGAGGGNGGLAFVLVSWGRMSQGINRVRLWCRYRRHRPARQRDDRRLRREWQSRQSPVPLGSSEQCGPGFDLR